MIRYICLGLMLTLLLVGVANEIKRDCLGRPAKPPQPPDKLTAAIAIDIACVPILLLVWYGAGLFDGLFR